jgi:hypothetical protein
MHLLLNPHVLEPPYSNFHTFTIFIFVFGVNAFRLDSQHLSSIMFQARKITLTMPTIPPRRFSQCLSHLGDEAPPSSFAQALPDIAEDREVETFTEIKEAELQHMTNVADTSVGAASSSQHARGSLLHSPK